MSDSESKTAPTGFSTGALEKGDYFSALSWLNDTDTDAVEISALRFDELEPTVRDLDHLNLDRFHYISFHAPSAFRKDQELEVLEWLKPVHERGWNIVVHPDVIYTPHHWSFLGSQLLIENMDRRKPVGRTVSEMAFFFDRLPEARFCLDVAHARQIDTTLTLMFHLFEDFCERIAEIHISELDSRCRHIQMSERAVSDYRSLPWQRLCGVPVIIESMLDQEGASARRQELDLARSSVASHEANGEGAWSCWFDPERATVGCENERTSSIPSKTSA